MFKDTTVHIDEFSMVPNKWMTKIYEAFVSVEGVNVNLYGARANVIQLREAAAYRTTISAAYQWDRCAQG